MTVASWPFECHEFYQLSAYSVFFRRVVVELLTEATKYDSCLMTGNVQRVGSWLSRGHGPSPWHPLRWLLPLTKVSFLFFSRRSSCIHDCNEIKPEVGVFTMIATGVRTETKHWRQQGLIFLHNSTECLSVWSTTITKCICLAVKIKRSLLLRPGSVGDCEDRLSFYSHLLFSKKLWTVERKRLRK